MNIFEFAMKMEKDGENFYRELSAKTNNRGLKTILNMLADEEVKHYNIFAQIASEKMELGDAPVLSRAKNIFQEMKDSGEGLDLEGTQVDLYHQAQEMEKKSRDFYNEKAAEVDNPYQKQMLEKIAIEENKHFQLLGAIADFVGRPETWLEDAEFTHLEEY
jgi:rubrerythrin